MTIFSIKRKRLNPDGSQAHAPNKRKKIFLLILFFILIASNLILFNRLMNSRKVIRHQHQVLMNTQEPTDTSSEISGKWYGLCEKNSIHSIQDFQNIVKNDAVLSEHFSDFDWGNARMGKLESAIWTHVAYRINDRISTTRRVIRLPKGDGYITDGKRWLRTYCCNDYVQAPDLKADTSFDKEVDRLASARTDGPDPQIITNVPEPSPLLLMGTGIALLALLTWRQRRLNGNS